MKVKAWGKDWEPSALVELSNENSDGFLDQAGPQTPRAHFDSLSHAIDQRPDTLKIGSKNPIGFIVCMTDVMTRHAFFPTY